MIGNKVCFFQVMESTNTFMKEHVSEFKHGDMICVKIQTAGRGRRSRSWVSREGNLHTSFLLDDAVRELSNFEVVMRVSVAIVEFLQALEIDAKIKYPNDIVVGSHKIAGILIEKIGTAYVVGVGINVAFTKLDKYDFEPSSILIETGTLLDYRDVLSLFIDSYNRRIDDSLNHIYEVYKKQSMVLGKEVVYEEETYVVIDVLISGELVLSKDQEHVYVYANEISLKELYRE